MDNTEKQKKKKAINMRHRFINECYSILLSDFLLFNINNVNKLLLLCVYRNKHSVLKDSVLKKLKKGFLEDKILF